MPVGRHWRTPAEPSYPDRAYSLDSQGFELARHPFFYFYLLPEQRAGSGMASLTPNDWKE
jgi:hypothetical protein